MERQRALKVPAGMVGSFLNLDLDYTMVMIGIPVFLSLQFEFVSPARAAPKEQLAELAVW